MDTTQQLAVALGAVSSYDDFFELRRRIEREPREMIFSALWPLAISRTENGAEGMAGNMLAELQPDPGAGLEELLTQVHRSQLDASNRVVPFYLVAEFGRQAVVQAAAAFLEALPSSPELSRVDSVRYWASFPASELCKAFHDWEAREMYGVSDEV